MQKRVAHEPNFQDVANRYSIRKFLLFQCCLSYKIWAKTDFFVYEGQFDFSSKILNKDISRRVVYMPFEKIVFGQELPGRNAISYNFMSKLYEHWISDLWILVEIFDTEEANIRETKDIGDDLSEVLQITYEIFLQKYNEMGNGYDFLTPLIYETGAQIIFLFILDIDSGQYNQVFHYVQPINSFRDRIFIPPANFSSQLNTPNLMWKYYFNKSIFSYNKYANYDCILFSAICLESYIGSIVEKNQLEQKIKSAYEEKTKTKCLEIARIISEKPEKSIHRFLPQPRGFSDSAEYLCANQYISKPIFSAIKDAYSKINTMRNQIVHGTLKSPIIDREKASDAINALILWKNQIPQEDENSGISSEPSSAEAYSLYFRFVNKIDEMDFVGAKSLLSTCIDKKIYLNMTYYLRGLCNLKIHDYEAAIIDFTESINREVYVNRALFGRFTAYKEWGKINLARQDIDILIAKCPNNQTFVIESAKFQ